MPYDNQLFDKSLRKLYKAISKSNLSQLGIKYITSTGSPPKSQTLYRVMAGSFKERENAERQVKKLNRQVFDATIMIFNK